MDFLTNPANQTEIIKGIFTVIAALISGFFLIKSVKKKSEGEKPTSNSETNISTGDNSPIIKGVGGNVNLNYSKKNDK
jgi:hypothetical protein